MEASADSGRMSPARVKEEAETDLAEMPRVKEEAEFMDEEERVKEECSDSDDGCGVSEAAMLAGLYAEHEVKDELVLGPERPHRPTVGLVVRERDDEATTSASTGSRGPRGKNAQYYRDYRARKRAEQEKELLNRTSDPSTIADSSTINAGSATLKKRKSAAEYQREYRARKKAKRDNILIDSLAVIPSISTGGFTTTHQSTIVDQLTTAGPSTSSDIGFAKPTRRKTPAEYQREYRARKKAQRESTRATKTNDGSMKIADENTSNIGDENARINRIYLLTFPVPVQA
ncbi:uncharacterized protein LOC133532636 [Cydia pomonella]|uniref:uncharacterized protein LOC133532636 n=1 Tax=Cydia pomonella TaxID=82600 RepID=UPI002ADDBC69|nr:uncharacterized protein LOC133532636 [Cydia pomonella]